MQTLNQNIKDHNFKPVHLLFDEEAFLKKSSKNRLKGTITDGDTMNYDYCEGRGMNMNEVISLSDIMPFFAEKRPILMEDNGFFRDGQEAEDITQYMERAPENICLIFMKSGVDERSKLYKAVKKHGYIVELSHQNTGQLTRWAVGILSENEKKTIGRTTEFSLNKTGDDIESISPKLGKLISYTLGRDVITDEDVEIICATQVTNKTFDMITTIAGRQTRKATDLYGDLLTLKKPPMRILFLIARQFNQTPQVKELMGKSLERGAIASKSKLQLFMTGKIMMQTKTSSRGQTSPYVNPRVDTEEGVEASKLQDRLAVELLITNQYQYKKE